MTWKVQLAGNINDLAILAKSFTGEDVHITHEGEEYYLISEQFLDTNDARAIQSTAQKIVELINGGMCLTSDFTGTVCVGALYKNVEGKSTIIIIVNEPIEISERVITPTVLLTHLDGTVQEYHPADQIVRWTKLALTDDSVASVLRIIYLKNIDWVNLYNIYEVIEKDVGGIDSIMSNGWATKKSISDFKRTANSPGALGIDARHGVGSSKVPNPMIITEAESLIFSIVHAWLRAK